MDVLEKELDLLHIKFENGLCYDDDSSEFLESARRDKLMEKRFKRETMDLSDKIESIIQEIIQKIKRLYITVREKIRQAVVVSKLEVLRENTVYEMYQSTGNAKLAMETRKLITFQNQGLLKLHDIYRRAISGKIPYDSAIRQGRMVTESYKKKIDETATSMIAKNINFADKSVPKKVTRLYKKEITRVMKGYLSEHEEVIEKMEEGIIDYEEKLIIHTDNILKEAKIEYRGLAQQFGNLASSLNNLVLRYESKIVAMYFAAITFVSVGGAAYMTGLASERGLFD